MVGAKTLLVAFASLVGVVSVVAVAAAQEDRGPGRTAPEAAEIAAVVPAPAPAAPPAVAPVAPVVDAASDATTIGELWVTYRSDVGGSISAVVLAEGGTVVSSAILQNAIAHRFELPAGTYLVDVMETSGLVTQGDVATSSASAVRSAPVVLTAGTRVDLNCAFSGCEVR